ncbi:MAG: alpha-glucuronidase family glycosyl hydrolase, partial [Christensenellaceae bacterium]
MAIELVKGGQSAYRIVIPAQAGPGVRYAAAELAKYLAAISGASLPVVEDGEAPQEKEIVIGGASRAGAPCAAGLKNDGYVLRTVGGRLFILGENDRGCLYGVYGLLEAYLGCRFLAREVEVVPAAADICLPEMDETKVSPLEYRETYWYEPERFGDFAMKRGFNASITQPYAEHLG